MSSKDLSRRDFTKLTMAALGGAVSGAFLAGCAKDKKDGGSEVATSDAHACRGLNACKGKGATGDNACAGQGKCATTEHHTCAGKNACKGQGGCGENPAANACKGQGGCAVPITMDEKWKKARANFEAEMTKQGKTFGDAPAKS